jgi:hypothetical protein
MRDEMSLVFSPVCPDRRKSPPPNPGHQDDRETQLVGLAVRVFLVEDDGYLRRLPLAGYERLLRGEAEGRLPQYAGKRVRYALVVVDLVDRKPIEIRHVEYSWLSFDSGGQLDRSEEEKEVRLAMEVLPPISGDESLQVIDARHLFARKSYDDRYKWKPSPEIQAALIAATFGQNTA